MKNVFAALALAAAMVPAAQAADVGVSISIAEPGVYGRIDIGRFPQPAVIVQQPVIVQRPVVVARPQPVYMWVPPGHRKNWKKHCGHYNACGVPVYFVRHDWYDEHVARPHGKGKGHGHGHGRGHDHGHKKGRH
jgi:hypothetical protein